MIFNGFDYMNCGEMRLCNVELSDKTIVPYFIIKIYKNNYTKLSDSPVIEEKGMTIKTIDSNSIIFFLRFNVSNDFLFAVKCDFNDPYYREILDKLLFAKSIRCCFIDGDCIELNTFFFPNLLKYIIKDYSQYYYCYDKTEYTKNELSNFMKIISNDINKRVISFEKSFYLT